MTPEMFANSQRVRFALVKLLCHGRVSISVIDKADYPYNSTNKMFRADCRALGASFDTVEALAQRGIASKIHSPPSCALSGTIQRQCITSIAEDCGLRQPLLLVSSVDRANLQHVQIRYTQNMSRKKWFSEVAVLALATCGGDSMLIYALTKKDVQAIAKHIGTILRLAGDDRPVIAIHGGDEISFAEKRRLVALFRGRPSILVTNSAGARGLDHPKLLRVVKSAVPTSLNERVQVDGRGARLSDQRATVTQLYLRKFLFSTASIIRDDDEKLAAFTDVIAVEEALRHCARSLVRFFYGEIAAPHNAQCRNTCCPS